MLDHAAALPLALLAAAGFAFAALVGAGTVWAHKHRRAGERRRRLVERARGGRA